MRRKAKCLKKQNKHLEAKAKEIAERERKLLEDFSKTRERLEVMEQERENEEEAAKSAQRELEHCNLMLARFRRERDTAQEQLSSLQKRAREVEEDLTNVHQSYQDKLKKADARAMKEVKELLDQHPKLVQENHTLKEFMAKKNQYIQALKKKVESLERSAHGRRVDQKIRQHERSGKHSVEEIARGYQEAREQEQWGRQLENLQRVRRKESKSETVARVAGKNSAHASRVASATLHITSKPKRAMDVLDSASRKNTSAKPTKQRRESSSSQSDGSVLYGVSLNVKSTKKKQRLNPPPPTERSAPNIVKRGGKNADIRKHFRTT
jgi:DNA repair exonuclease SbcCD ATPase subunit